MNPWQLLEIAPTGETRTIKRAYAKKLKQTRPDEKPHEFQRLHAAYKQALRLAAEQSQTDASDGSGPGEVAAEMQPEVSAPLEPLAESTGSGINSAPVPAAAEPGNHAGTEQQASHQQPESASAQEEPVPAAGLSPSVDEQEAEQRRNARIDEFHRVLAQVDAVLADPARINARASWQFLADSPFILEEEYNWNLGLGVFQRVARYSVAVAGSQQWYTDKPEIASGVLRYCDSLFAWSEDPAGLQEQFDAELLNAVLPRLDGEETVAGDPQRGLRGGRKLVLEWATPEEERFPEYYFGSLLARAFAVLLDVFLVYVALGIITSAVLIKNGASEGEASSVALLVSVAGYLVLAWLAESSRWQATPGKFLLGYRVTNRQFRRMGYGHGLWRVLSFSLTVPLYWLAWLVNCFLNGNLLHDRLSRSYVINWRKSREEAGG
ncbi:RDD family protein [Microbulbifer sp. YPW16]|uniref:RDD family protein n=1 Tax=Microbulbifer sp. YPW16 TaxID=2904242 RepID=UPI001E4A6B61|nr:RDD family protein [Microbulbifer sp. YPW16]UHQ55073.1 RDD family protein [Microbulbifer sp. YPW16]